MSNRWKKLSLFAFLGALFLIFSFPVYAQENMRHSLGLNGCWLVGLSQNADGSFVLASCSGPKGVYFSRDYGDSWTFGEGGAYSAGTTSSSYITSDAAFLTGQSKLYKTTLPESASAVWTPSWEVVDLSMNVTSITGAGNYLAVIGTGYNPGIKIVDPASLTTVDSVSFSESQYTGVSNFGYGNGYLYALMGLPSGGTDSALLRFTVDSSGALGDPVDISNATGFAADSYFWSSFVSPAGKLYVTKRMNAGGNDVVYQSTDNGESFTATGLTAGVNGACFNGDVHIVDSYVSENSGSSWTQITLTNDTDSDGFQTGPCLIHPTDTNRALLRTSVAMARVENLVDNTGTFTWTPSRNGLDAVNAYHIAQLPDAKDTVLVQTSAGYAFTNNFTDDEPTWLFPLCPLGDCSAFKASGVAAIEPGNPNTLYAGASALLKGTVSETDGSATIAWANLADRPDGTWSTTFIRTYSFLPNTVVVGYAKTGSETPTPTGGLYFYNATTGATIKSALTGTPINQFIAVDENLMFAAAGGANEDSATSASRGVYRSTDGGTTWNKVTDSNFTDTILIHSFAYDSANDTLYAAWGDSRLSPDSESGNIFILKNPAAGNEDWVVPTGTFAGSDEPRIVFTSVAVDPASNIYASAGRQIWVSSDQGDTWSTYFTGLLDEEMNVLLFDELTQGSNAGLNEISTSSVASPVYALWNGFLNMTNILELVNKGSTAMTVTLTMFDINGAQVHQQTVSIGGQNQLDVILNDLPGFARDSYGIVRLTFAGLNLDGRLSFYRSAASANYEFAFAVPFTASLTGSSAVGFNTFQPSQNPTEASDQVAQWLSIVNLDTLNAKNFTVVRYDMAGTQLSSSTYSVPAFGRVDLEAGHVNPGPSNVGLHVILPEDTTSPYMAHLVRYGARVSTGGFAFAFPLLAQAGSGEQQWVPISNGAGGANWVELLNAGDTAANVLVEFYDNYGTRVAQQSVSLAAHAQEHIFASGSLGSGVTGAARIVPGSSDARIIAESMFYFRDSSQSIEGMYGSQARTVGNGIKYGSYNLYLNMYNWLRVFNTSGSSQTIDIIVYNTAGEANAREVTLAAYSGVDLGLHETSTYGTAVNTYGQLSVQGPVLVEMLRLRPTTSGGIDFAAPTLVR